MLKNDKGNEPIVGAVLISGLKGTAFGILSTLLLSLIFTAVCLAFADPNAAMKLLAYGVLAIGALGGGIVAVKSDREHRLLSAIIGAGLYVTVMFTSSLFVCADGAPSVLFRLTVWAICFGVGVIGGVIGKGRPARIGEGKKSPAAMARRRLSSKR